MKKKRPSKRIAREMEAAMRDLRELTEITKRQIHKLSERGDSGKIAELINEQRHNLKVLLRNLRRMSE